MPNITKLTEDYIRNHPSIKQSLKNDVINYSKLSRLIAKEKNIDDSNFDAVLIACRRYAYKLKRSSASPPIIRLLRDSSLKIRNKVIVVILEPDINYDRLIKLQKDISDKKEVVHVVRGASAITLITTEQFLPAIERRFKHRIMKVSKDLVEIILKSSAKLESIPGVMGYLYSLFGENNINIIETISCWTDTIFVIKKGDIPKTMAILSFD